MITKNIIIEKISTLLEKNNYLINSEVKPFIDDYSGPFSQALKKNYVYAQNDKLPLCQDTGMIEFFVFLGNKVELEESLETTLNEAVKRVYVNNPFRFSIVEDPLFERINTKNNTPCIVHLFSTGGNTLEIRALVKGGGSENLSRLFMLKPSSSVQDLKDIVITHIKENGMKACPPLHVGIGIGGSSDKALVLSKLALTKSFYEKNLNEKYSKLEEELKEEINRLKIGFQGLKEGISAYSVHIEAFPTHIATLPVGISVDCYLCRKGVVKFEDR